MPPADAATLSQSQTTPVFGFKTPEPRQSSSHQSPDSPTAPPTDDLELGELEPDSPDDWADERLPDPSDDTHSRASTPASKALNDEALRDMFRGGVAIAGDQAHNLLAKTPGQQQVGLYKTDTEDQANIGDPLARIAGRHQGVGEISPDTADLLAAMVGLTRFATRQVNLRSTARELDSGLAARSQVQEFPAGAAEAVDL